MKKIGIIAKNIPEARKASRKLAAWLEARGKKVFIDSETAAAINARGYEPANIPALVEMIIVLGGDGTLLSAARLVADSHTDVPIFGVNLGSLGFMAEVSLDELYGNLEKAIAGKLGTEDRIMLTASVVREGKRIAQYRVLNDAVINKGALARMMELRVSVKRRASDHPQGRRIDRGDADGLHGLLALRRRSDHPSYDPLFCAHPHLSAYIVEPAYRAARHRRGHGMPHLAERGCLTHA